MLSKCYRLPLTTEFNRIKKKGWMINGPLFGLLIATRQRRGSLASLKLWRSGPPAARDMGQRTRFGFIISTKIDKRSVVRHRIKRLLSEAIQLNLGKIKPGYDFVFLAKKEIIEKSFKEVKKEVESCLGRTDLLTED